MITPRAFAPIGLSILLAAGGIGALVAAQPPGSDEQATQSAAGWEIRGDVGFLTMSRQIGRNRIEYNIYGGSHAVPFRESFRVETETSQMGCAGEEDVSVGNPVAAQRVRLIRVQIERRLASMGANCTLPPPQSAALIQGFDAAYAVFAARFDRARTALDTSPDREAIDSQERALASMHESESNMAMDVNVDANVTVETSAAMNEAAVTNAAAEGAPPPTPKPPAPRW